MLSGFYIAYNYEKLRENKITKRTFGVARIARVYPLHWLTLFIAVALGGYVIASGPVDWLKHFLASLTLTNAYIPKADYFFHSIVPRGVCVVNSFSTSVFRSLFH